MGWRWDRIEVREPLMQEADFQQKSYCVDRDFLDLKSSLPKWQSTSDVVRRLAHLVFLSRAFF